MRNLFLLFFLCGLISCKVKERADLIIYDARIHTPVYGHLPATHIAIKDGKIIALGNQREIMNNFDADSTFNAGGRFLYPGFYDSHCHFYGYAEQMGKVNLTGTSSFDEVLEKIKIFASENPDFEWITGRGWDQNDWEIKEFPDREKLDSLFPDKPVIVRRVDGHGALANNQALTRAGINKESVIPGGFVEVKEGRLTGILLDNAADEVLKFVPETSSRQMAAYLKKASEDCAKVGLTSLADAGLDLKQMKLLDSLQQAGIIKQRLHVMLNPKRENFNYFMETGGKETEMFRVKSIKIYVDGALGSRGALLKQPYSDDPEKWGLLLTPVDTIREILKFCYDNNLQVNAHCIGDSAIGLMLNLYGELLKGSNDRRWRIEHAQVADPADIPLFGKFTVIPSVQPVHAISDMPWAEKRLGPERIKGAYAYKSLMEQNQILALGSDFPIENINPLFGFYAAVSRQDFRGNPPSGWYIEEKISREEAFDGLSVWGAVANFADTFSGNIEPGKVADFVILNEDIFSIPVDRLPQIQVYATFIGGKKVY